ncbi:MAG: MBOAT family protein [Proteobacteria bacterium]|nr:MBOAT family protein [Pseudomonadota bacterium]
MLFNSLDYLLFLLLAVCGYWFLARVKLLRLLFVFGCSCVFYTAWSPRYVVLILGSVLLDYTAARAIHASSTPRVRRFWLGASLAGNLGLLGVFKYFNFFATAFADGLGLVGLHVTAPYLDVLLPVGISFYTFQTISYTVDVYRGELKPTRNLLEFAFYVTFFPQLVAGPIVRATEFLPQLRSSAALQSGLVGEGMFLIATGLLKKVAVADYLAVNLVDRVFDDPSAYSAAEVMVGLYGYTLQIYCDFSGYTDVARGSAMLFGLRLPENFDRPYAATSPADFWRRWHMTLSSWLRDYLYFPLGGSRVHPLRAYWNLGLTMFLIGLWHGAAWTFVVYGLIQAAAMVAHRFLYLRSGRTRLTVDSRPVTLLKITATLHFVVLSRIFFRSTGWDNALAVGGRLLDGSFGLGHVTLSIWCVLLAGYAAHYLPAESFERLKHAFVQMPAPAQGVALAALAAGLLLTASQEVVPYIYFQF